MFSEHGAVVSYTSVSHQVAMERFFLPFALSGDVEQLLSTVCANIRLRLVLKVSNYSDLSSFGEEVEVWPFLCSGCGRGQAKGRLTACGSNGFNEDENTSDSPSRLIFLLQFHLLLFCRDAESVELADSVRRVQREENKMEVWNRAPRRPCFLVPAGVICLMDGHRWQLRRCRPQSFRAGLKHNGLN